MWSHDYSLTTDLDSDTLWLVLIDVDGWVRWNDGIDSIELTGPPTVGTTFRMTPPGEDAITSTIVGLEPGDCSPTCPKWTGCRSGWSIASIRSRAAARRSPIAST